MDTYLNSYPSLLEESWLKTRHHMHRKNHDIPRLCWSLCSPAWYQTSFTQLHTQLAQGRKGFVWCYTAVREETGDGKSWVSATPTATAPGTVTRVPRHHCNTHQNLHTSNLHAHYTKPKCGCGFSHGKLSCIPQSSAELTLIWKPEKYKKHRSACTSHISLKNSMNHSTS